MTKRGRNRWPRVPIKEAYVGLYDGPHATPKPADDGPTFLGIGNIAEDGHLDLRDIRHIGEDDYPYWTRRVTPQPDDIVFTYEATLNRYAVIPPGFRGCLGRRLALIRPNPDRVDARFLHYQFLGEDWRRTVSENTILGATVDRIPLIRFPGFPIVLPPLPVQRRIAAILSAYDDLIENNTRRIKILEEMAQTIYREWFVHFRFPGHTRVKLASSPLGPIPHGWEVKKATDAISVDPPTPVPREGGKPFVPMSSLSSDSMLVHDFELRTGNSGSKFRNGDTLFARITPCLENGKTAFVQFLPTDQDVAFGSTEFIVLRSKTLCPELVYLLARSADFRNNAIKSMSGASGRQRVQPACFDRFLLPHPDQRTLRTFAEQVSPMFQWVQILAAKNKNLRKTRDLLLPKLISGEADVSDLNINLGDAAA